MSRISIFAVVVVFGWGVFAMAVPVRALELELVAGASASFNAMRIKNAKRNKHKVVGEFASQWSLGPWVRLGHHPLYFGRSRLGWMAEANFGSYSFSRQRDPSGTTRNFGTKIAGSYASASPLLIYRLGDRFRLGKNHWSATFGLGYAVALMSVDGKFVTNHLHPSAVRDVEIKGSTGLFSSVLGFARFQYRRLFVNLSVGSSASGATFGDYRYEFQPRSLRVGYFVPF